MSVAVPQIPGDRRLGTCTVTQSIGHKCTLIRINCFIVSEHTTQYVVQTVCALLTKLQDYCISQFGVIINQCIGVVMWASPKCSRMYSALPHSAGCEGVPPPRLCTFRKSELCRGMATDWWMWVQETQSGIYNCVQLCRPLHWQSVSPNTFS